MTIKSTSQLIEAIEETASTNRIASRGSVGLECAWACIRRAQLLLSEILKDSSKTEDDATYDCLLLLTNALSDLCEAVYSTSSGFWRGPGLLVRGAVEDISCAVACHCDEGTYARYKHGRLKATKTLPLAKEHFPSLLRVYDIFSEAYVHSPHDMIGRTTSKVEKGFEIALISDIDSTNLPLHVLLCAALTAREVGALSEWIVLGQLQDPYYYRKVSETDYKPHQGTREDILIKEFADQVDSNE